MRYDNLNNIVKRILGYVIGMVILAVGLTLNTKVTLGVSPIISVSFVISEIMGLNFGDMTFVWYGIFILMEILIHLIEKASDKKKKLMMDVLQFPVSLIFTRFMNLFSLCIPVFEEKYVGTFFGSVIWRVEMLVVAILLTGFGAALSLDMRLIPNPGDGVVQTISDWIGKPLGTVKNIFDISCVAIAVAFSLIFNGRIIGVGIGTVCAMLGVGRVVAFVNSRLLNLIKL